MASVTTRIATRAPDRLRVVTDMLRAEPPMPEWPLDLVADLAIALAGAGMVAAVLWRPR